MLNICFRIFLLFDILKLYLSWFYKIFFFRKVFYDALELVGKFTIPSCNCFVCTLTLDYMFKLELMHCLMVLNQLRSIHVELPSFIDLGILDVYYSQGT